jgi:hypothetical protein
MRIKLSRNAISVIAPDQLISIRMERMFIKSIVTVHRGGLAHELRHDGPLMMMTGRKKMIR